MEKYLNAFQSKSAKKRKQEEEDSTKQSKARYEAKRKRRFKQYMLLHVRQKIYIDNNRKIIRSNI